MCFPALQIRLNCNRVEIGDVRGAPNDCYTISGYLPPPYRDLPIALIRTNHRVGQCEGGSLKPDGNSIKGGGAIRKPRPEEFRHKVMVVKHKAGSVGPQHQGDQEEQIRWVTRMENVEWSATAQVADDLQSAPQGAPVLK